MVNHDDHFGAVVMYQICFDAKIASAMKRRRPVVCDRVIQFAETARNGSIAITDAEKTQAIVGGPAR